MSIFFKWVGSTSKEYLGGTNIQKHHKLSQKQPWNSPVEDDYTIPILEESFNNTQVYDNHIPFFKKGFPEKKHMCCIKIAWRHISFHDLFVTPVGFPTNRFLGVHHGDKGNKRNGGQEAWALIRCIWQMARNRSFWPRWICPKVRGLFWGKKVPTNNNAGVFLGGQKTRRLGGGFKSYESRHQHGAIDMTGGFKYFLFWALFGEDSHFD